MVGDNYREKQAELARLKEEYLTLFKKHEDLSKENFAIYNRYNLLFGEKYYERYLLFCETERLRRKIELYNYYINRGEKIDKAFVEALLNAEFREYEERLDTLLEEYNAAQEYEKLPAVTREEAKEIRRIYLKIAKRIHPDLNRDASSAEKELWLKTLDAYQLNDLETLRECESMLDDVAEEQGEKTGSAKLDEEIENFKEKIEFIQNRNITLVNSFPYNQKELLTDSEWIQDRLAEIESDIELFQRTLEYLKARLQEIDPTYEKEIC